MPRTIRISDLLGLVVLAAAALALLRGPLRESTDFSLVLTPLFVTVVLAAVMVATLVARFGRGRRRVFAWGFAWFGWVYFLGCVYSPAVEARLGGPLPGAAAADVVAEPLAKLAMGVSPSVTNPILFLS
jgi:hypothetical protein